jgi:hypothetical protein
MAKTVSYSSSAVMAPLDVPQTQNTAPVLEFRCLYTQDLRRKQKRWQDGRLKFHSFNKRVMVYDERSNFVGDIHWREDSEFGEGEELELERGGILVEVGECVGRREQDLTELVDKRVKEREERAAAKATGGTSARAQASLGTAPHLPQKPLNAMIIPTGHYGRALLLDASPFEERRGLASGNQVGNDNERPPKRQKQNDSVPSKKGYAQNLIGVTLNLASTKPPSTATVRHDPLRARSAVRVEPIDLTLDNDKEDENRRVGQNATGKEREHEARPSKIQKRYNKSPPARSGYASNLTGAALTLSRPEYLPARSTSEIRRVKSSKPRRQQEMDISSSLEDSPVEVEAPKKARAAANIASKKLNSPKPGSVLRSRSSSPVLPDRNTPAFRSAKASPRTAAQISSGIGATREQPMSALRIKPRPPQKMMMLMERPSSKLRTPSDPSGKYRIMPKAAADGKVAPNGVALSQAAMQLNAFCRKQEERLQARLNGQRLSKVREDLEDLSSSPVDSGINHQMSSNPTVQRHDNPPINRKASFISKPKVVPATNDSDLASSPVDANTSIQSATLESVKTFQGHKLQLQTTRRSSPQAKVSADPSFPEINICVDLDRHTQRSKSNDETVAQEAGHLVRGKGLHRSTRRSPPPTLAHVKASRKVVIPSTQPDQVLASADSDKQDPEDICKDEVVINAPGQPLEQDQPRRQQRRRTPHEEFNADALKTIAPLETHSDERGDGAYSEFADPKDIRKDGAVADTLNRPAHEDTVTQSPPPTVLPPVRPHVAVLDDSMQFATDHFRAILKSSASSSNQNPGVSSLILEAYAEELRPPTNQLREPTRPQLASNEVAMKLSPELSPMRLAPFVGPGTWDGIESTSVVDLADIPEAPASPILVSHDSKLLAPRIKLANPATRGKSVQTLAAVMTVDMTAPAFNAMAPPTTRVTNRPERIYPRHEEPIGRAGGRTARGAASTGPWSRESFDLFGSWRAPEKDAANAVTG